MAKKKKEEESLISIFFNLFLVLPYHLVSTSLKLLIGIPIGLFIGLIQFANKKK